MLNLELSRSNLTRSGETDVEDFGIAEGESRLGALEARAAGLLFFLTGDMLLDFQLKQASRLRRAGFWTQSGVGGVSSLAVPPQRASEVIRTRSVEHGSLSPPWTAKTSIDDFSENGLN